jgi:NAD(P)-dependent dehydrogenase (short-subunit alcohol dehydrogenase family)
MTDLKIAVVTGGASGIGWASAQVLARQGLTPVLADIDRDAAEAKAEELKAAGRLAYSAGVDVGDRTALADLAGRVERDIGPVAALVASAGVLQAPGPFLEMDPDEEERVWRINYFGTGATVRAFAPAMAERGAGAIVTLGSINSFDPLPLPAYNPSKAAVQRLTELLACELGPKGVRVNGVAPTYTMTPPILAKVQSGERDAEAFRAAHALPILVYPEQIAEAVGFLCSEAASAITGVMLPVDAGWRSAITYKTFPGKPV